MNDEVQVATCEEYVRTHDLAESTLKAIQSLGSICREINALTRELCDKMKPLAEWLVEQDRLLTEQEQLPAGN